MLLNVLAGSSSWRGAEGREKVNRKETRFSIEMAGSTMLCYGGTINYLFIVKLNFPRNYHGVCRRPFQVLGLVKKSGKLNLKNITGCQEEESMDLPSMWTSRLGHVFPKMIVLANV